MTQLGPFLLGAPWALAALLALPVIWWILRATPPAPKDIDLPSLRILEGAEPREETPARTPWWVWLIRTLAVIAAILGLAQPVYAPGAKTEDAGASGPVLIVMDNGWPSAPRWGELMNAATATLDGAERDAPVHLLLTAPQQLNANPAERMSRTDAAKRISSLRPLAWNTDRKDALERLRASGLRPSRIFWASDGLDSGSGRAFAEDLAAIAPMTVFAAPPRGPAAITAITSETDSVSVTLRRADPDGTERAFVSAMTLDGSALATAEVSFDGGATEAQADFTIPAAALARIARFAVTGRQGAGTVWLWDSADRSRRVGLVGAGADAQPLLSDMHYVRKALEPFASITEGDIETLVAESPDAIILTDVGQILPEDAERLAKWVEEGGALIRFAGRAPCRAGRRFAARAAAPVFARPWRGARLGRAAGAGALPGDVALFRPHRTGGCARDAASACPSGSGPCDTYLGAPCRRVAPRHRGHPRHRHDHPLPHHGGAGLGEPCLFQCLLADAAPVHRGWPRRVDRRRRRRLHAEADPRRLWPPLCARPGRRAAEGR
ncbi:MAG: BatA domain-containing protein [Hyphomonas sp.]